MLLEDEQKDLLIRFVEAHRSTPRDARAGFLAIESMGATEATFIHTRVPGLQVSGSRADAEILSDAGLLRTSFNSRGAPIFSVRPEGVAYYEELLTGQEPAKAVESDVRRFLALGEFQKEHSAALRKWEQAATLLWSADSREQLTTIGHLCRECLQEFAQSLAAKHGVDVTKIEPAKTVARIKAVRASRAMENRSADSAFLDALTAYWGTLSDLVQRQEHGALKEGTPLVWEDARRVVFQTCIVMYEVDRAL